MTTIQKALYGEAGSRYRPIILIAITVAVSIVYGLIVVRFESIKGAMIGLLMWPILIAVLRRPDYIVVSLMAAMLGYVTRLIVLKGILVSDSVIGVVWLIFIFQRLRGQQAPLVKDKITWVLVAYLLMVVSGLWYAVDTNGVYQRLTELSRPLLIYLILVNVLSEPRMLRRGIWLTLIIASVIGALAIYHEVTKTYGDRFGGLAGTTLAYIDAGVQRPRASGSTEGPNRFGLQMAVLVPFGLWAATQSTTWRGRIAGILVTIACLGGLLLSFSRGAYLAVLAALVLFLIYCRLNVRYWLVILLLAGCFGAVAPSEVTNRFLTLDELWKDDGQGIYAEGSFLNRTVYFRMGTLMFLDNPVLGVGAHNFRTHYPDYTRSEGSPVKNEERDPHNMYIEVASEHGVIGIIIVGALLMMTWQRLFTAQRLFNQVGDRQMAGLAVALQLSLVSHMVTGLFTHLNMPMYWVLPLAMTVALHAAAQRRVAAQTPVDVAATGPGTQLPRGGEALTGIQTTVASASRA
jgi:O-antigen ligase